jgi:hypothetical protein
MVCKAAWDAIVKVEPHPQPKNKELLPLATICHRGHYAKWTKSRHRKTTSIPSHMWNLIKVKFMNAQNIVGEMGTRGPNETKSSITHDE